MPHTRKHRNRRFTGHVAKKGVHNNGHTGSIIGLIFANWCGHCQSLKPHWLNMKKTLSSNPKFRNQSCKVIEIEDSDKDKDKKIAQINATVNGTKLVANGYPTIFKKKGGVIEYYSGEREANALTRWAGGDPEKMTGGYIIRSSPINKKTRRVKPGIRL
jgi:thiol-disulfide isomerase/thioredoxin